jgi:crotonobetainyl-CoA:carnitine CoA-transferase CaiB-like acyl-CoA transferase
VDEWTRKYPAEEVMFKMQDAGIAAGVVKNAKDMYEDPQMQHRGHFWESTEPGMEQFTFESPSSRLSKTPARFQRRYPFMGEHNTYVYNELLGISDEEFAQLLEEKVIS